MKHTKKTAGSLGGRTTVHRYGRGHMARIGSAGGRATRERYELVPVNVRDFAMVDRRSRKIKAYLSGEKWERPTWEKE